MAMIGKVRRMYFREKKPGREIVRTSMSRNTVRKWLKAAVLEEPKYRHSEAPGKLTPFHESIKLALKVDAHRPRHEQRTAGALHAQIKAEGYAGCYSRVTDFIRASHQGEGRSISSKAFVPLSFELGEAFAALRVRHAGGNAGKARLRRLQWLLIEWSAGDAEQQRRANTSLSTLPEDTPFNELVSAARQR
jgi:hypothetical protein